MGKKTKKRLSCFLCAMLLFVTGIETSAFTGVFAATARKIDVWDFGAVQESDTQLYNNHISAQDWEQCENVSSAGKFAEEPMHLRKRLMQMDIPQVGCITATVQVVKAEEI